MIMLMITITIMNTITTEWRGAACLVCDYSCFILKVYQKRKAVAGLH
jgi:hypothetical protein